MKTDTRHNLGWGARSRLFGRIIGLTGFFAALAGLFVFLSIGRQLTFENLRSAISEGSGAAMIAATLLAIGGVVTVLWIIVESISWLGGSGQRSVSGANSMLQVVLALAVFVGVNVLGFNYFKRWDFTRNQDFTLPETVALEMKHLKGKTTIVVLQQHKTFGQLSPKPDVYDYAAERKVVDKVHDLVNQLRLFGPQFNVIALDVEEDGYDTKLDAETARRPGLKEAINAAPENSIFFYPDDRVVEIPADEATKRAAKGSRVYTQAIKDSDKFYAYSGNIPRLSFNEFYQLDKSASKEANPGLDGKARGNLVLRPQGVEAFARRVLAIEEKRPKIGLLLIHEALSSDLSEGWQEQYTTYGLRKTLENYGFEVVDVLLKSWPPNEEPKPAAYNKDETKFERLEAELKSIEEDLRGLREEKREIEEFYKLFKESTVDQLKEKAPVRLRREITEEFRQSRVQAASKALEQVEERFVELEKDRKETETEVQALMKNERAFEDRQVGDVKTKMTRLLAGCDLLIIPRHTLINTSAGQSITSSLYKLSLPQVEVLKDYLKQGKPILACLGPNNEENAPPSFEPLDDFEKLLTDRGIELGRQTIVFDVESKGFAARAAGNMLGGAPSEIPPVVFLDPPSNKAKNPIAKAMAATSRSADQRLEIRLRHPRPIYLAPGVGERSKFAADFMMTTAAAWNEEQPFLIRRQISPREFTVRRPRYEATPFGDAKKGTRDEERRGPFSVAVAIESTMPVEWYDDTYTDARKAASILTRLDPGILAACLTARAAVDPDKETKEIAAQTKRASGRLVVIGQGGLFSGKQLSPAHEQLLLHTCNWLLKRDDRLPKTEAEWTYPRIQRDERESFSWKYGPFLGLPALFLYLGLIVWIVRRVR